MAHEDDANDGEDTIVDGDYVSPDGVADPFEVQSILADMDDFTNDDLPPEEEDLDEDDLPEFEDDEIEFYDDDDSTDSFEDPDEFEDEPED